MKTFGWRRGVVLVGLMLALGGAVLASRSPIGTALLKTKRGFVSHPTDDRVFFEAGAEVMADQIATFLPVAVNTIVAAQGRPFRKPFRVYVCATQESLNEFLALPPEDPIRGAVRFGDVLLSPSAFDWLAEDLHKESLLHELSHLHLRQQVGFLADRGKIPSWFHEGLADLVSGAGGEGVSEEEAMRAIAAGHALRPDSTGRLWSFRRVESGGLSGPMFHRQARMFVTFLRDRDPVAFGAFLSSLEARKELAGPFRAELGQGVREAWEEFVASR